MAALLSLLPLFLSLASALPSVTPSPLPTGSCYSYPLWQGSGGEHIDLSGGLYIHPAQADNSSIDGLYMKSGWQNPDVLAFALQRGATGYIMCNEGVIKDFYSSDALYIDPTTGALGFLGAGFPVAGYHHLVDGGTQSGVFLGYNNVTAWAYLYVPAADGHATQVSMRLLDLQDGALNDGEFYGFLQITS
jgi:hypothetical protein